MLLPGGDSAAVALRIPPPADPRAEAPGNGSAGECIVPIFIGPVEAAAIARVERGIKTPRPLTHELLGDILAATGVTMLRVAIDDLRDGVFHATLELRLGGTATSVWATPSRATGWRWQSGATCPSCSARA